MLFRQILRAPGVILVGLLLAHAKVAEIRPAVLIAPGDVDVIRRAVQLCERPDVAVVEKRGAVDAFEL